MAGWIIRFSLRAALRKLAAGVALLALLLPSMSILAEALPAADLPACCNTVYCPLHHRQSSELQRDRSLCDSTRTPGQKDCSMRACDSAPKSVVASAAFVLVTPAALRGPSVAEDAPSPALPFIPYAPAFPFTPPPRNVLN
jgi:hypothetical protein